MSTARSRSSSRNKFGDCIARLAGGNAGRMGTLGGAGCVPDSGSFNAALELVRLSLQPEEATCSCNGPAFFAAAHNYRTLQLCPEVLETESPFCLLR